MKFLWALASLQAVSPVAMFSEMPQKPAEQVFGLEVLVGTKLKADRDFGISSIGKVWWGDAEGHRCLCRTEINPDPIRRGETFRVSGVTSNGECLFLEPLPEAPEEDLLCGTDVLLTLRAEVEGLKSQVHGNTHDINNLYSIVSTK